MSVTDHKNAPEMPDADAPKRAAAAPRNAGRSQNRPPRIRLPFDDRRRGDAGAWAYDHRVGLAVTVIAYLLIGIAFVGGKIAVGGKPSSSTIIIDLHTLEQLDEERERLQQEIDRRQREQADWRSIRNLASN